MVEDFKYVTVLDPHSSDSVRVTTEGVVYGLEGRFRSASLSSSVTTTKANGA